MRLTLTKEEIGKGQEGQGKGLEIAIEGIQGDPSEKSPGTSVFIEYYEGKVQLHLWTNGVQDCQTITLT